MSPELLSCPRRPTAILVAGADSSVYKHWLGCAGLNVSGAAITTLNGQPNTHSGSIGGPAPAVSLEASAHVAQSQANDAGGAPSILDTDHKLLQAELSNADTFNQPVIP